MPGNAYAGSACYVQWVSPSGTISLYVDARSFSYTPSIDFLDTTCGTVSSRRRVPSYRDGEASLSMLAQTDGTALLTACAEGVYGTLTWGPAGTTTGRPKKVIAAYATGVEESYPYDDVAEWTVTWQQDGVRTDGAW